MRIILALLFVFVSSTLAYQSIPKEKIMGEWMCKAVTFEKDEMLRDTSSQQTIMKLKMVREAFINSSFIFGADGFFRVKFPANKSNQVAEELSFMNAKSWATNLKTNMIDIGGMENIMHIQVQEGNGVTSFLLFETPIVLTMKKIER